MQEVDQASNILLAKNDRVEFAGVPDSRNDGRVVHGQEVVSIEVWTARHAQLRRVVAMPRGHRVDVVTHDRRERVVGTRVTVRGRQSDVSERRHTKGEAVAGARKGVVVFPLLPLLWSLFLEILRQK